MQKMQNHQAYTSTSTSSGHSSIIPKCKYHTTIIYMANVKHDSHLRS